MSIFRKMSSIVQSVLFNKNNFKLKDAISWLNYHNYKINKVDITENYFRFRQEEPKELKRKGYTKYRNKEIGGGIILVLVYKN